MRNFTFMKSSGKSLLLILFFTLMSLNVFAEGTTSVSHNLVNISALCSVSDLTSAPTFNVAEDNGEKHTISKNATQNLYYNNQISDLVKQNNVLPTINFKRSNILNEKVLSPVFFLNQYEILINQLRSDIHRLFFNTNNEKYAETDNRTKFSNVFSKQYLFIDPECLFTETNLVNEKQTKSTFYKTHRSYKEIKYGFVNSKENLIYSSQLV